MLRNNILIAWRYLRKDKTLSVISIAGLSVSLAVCILMFRYTFFEMRYDRFNKNENRIYQLYTRVFENKQLISTTAFTSITSGPEIKGKILGVEKSVRFVNTKSWFDCTLSYNDGFSPVIFNEHHLYYADPSLFSVFSFPLVQGNRNTALEKPYTAVLSESVAGKYFKNENPLGKTLHLKGSGDEHDYTVTGIMRDIPANSNIDADVLLSINSIAGNPHVDNFGVYTFLLVDGNRNFKNLNNKLDGFISKYQPELNTGNTTLKLGLIPLKYIHLHSPAGDEMKVGGNATTVYFLLLVALVILAIAWVNYINLAATRSVSRAREVSIRKISGAEHRHLVAQFLTESFLVNSISLALALILLYYLAPGFHKITTLSVSFSHITGMLLSMQGLAAAILFFTGIFISGYFPARIIASARTTEVLKGKYNSGKKGLALRRLLVTVQFSAAIILSVSVLTFNRQLQFMQNQNIGADIDRVMVIKVPATFDSLFLKRISVFKNLLENKSIISSVATSSTVPGDAIDWTGEIKQKKNSYEKGLNFRISVIDPDFIRTYHLRLLAGRDFIPADFPLDKFGMKTEAVILNRTAVRQLGFRSPEESIGQNIYWNNYKCEVIGVIDDYHQQSLKESIQPMLYTVNHGPDLSLRLEKKSHDKMAAMISIVYKAWNSIFPDAPFNYFMLKDFYKSQYTGDRQLINIFRFFSVLAIFISCLGLFGLSSFTAQQRTREMSIRKILGATLLDRLLLLTREFFLLIVTASCLALPLSWLGMKRWLENFAYPIKLSGQLFILPVVFIILVTLVTVSTQVLKTVFINPVDSLKAE